MLPVRHRDAVKVIIDVNDHHSKQTFALTRTIDRSGNTKYTLPVIYNKGRKQG